MNRFLLTSLRPHHTFATADGVSWLPWRWAVSFIGLGKRQQKTFCSELAPSSWMSHECLFSSDASRDLFFCALTKASELKSSNTNHPKKSPMIFLKPLIHLKPSLVNILGRKTVKKSQRWMRCIYCLISTVFLSCIWFLYLSFTESFTKRYKRPNITQITNIQFL